MMRDIRSTRRAFLKGSTGALGALAMPVSIAAPARDAEDEQIKAQKAFLKSVLHKHVKRSNHIQRKHVDAFTQRLCEQHGLVDYRQQYSGLVGEYRLTRLFVRSLYLSS